MLILFIVAAFLRLNVFFTVLYLFLGLALMSRLWMRRRVELLRAERRFVNRAFFGEQVPVDLSVQNPGWMPVPWLELHESVPVDLLTPPLKGRVVSLGARERWQLRYTLSCRKRGYYLIGPLMMKTGDLLGIERTSAAQVAPDYLIVYPRVVPLQRLGLPTRSPLVALPAKAPLFEDPARVIGVRDYQHGDSPRRIHWTATASAGRMLVKQYQPSIARETLICLDLATESYEPRGRYTATELAITVAASVASHIIVREGLAAGLATEAWDPSLEDRVHLFLPPRSERAHLMSILEVLARAQIVAEAPFPDYLRRASVRLAWGATVLVITGRESAELFDTLVYLRHAGFAVALVLVQPGRPSAELTKRADLLKVPVHRVWREQDLERWE